MYWINKFKWSVCTNYSWAEIQTSDPWNCSQAWCQLLYKVWLFSFWVSFKLCWQILPNLCCEYHIDSSVWKFLTNRNCKQKMQTHQYGFMNWISCTYEWILSILQHFWGTCLVHSPDLKIRAWGYKTFFMLNSA